MLRNLVFPTLILDRQVRLTTPWLRKSCPCHCEEMILRAPEPSLGPLLHMVLPAPANSSNLELRALGKKIPQRHRPVTLTLAISCTKSQAKFSRDIFLQHLEFCPCLKDASHKTWDLVPKESTSHAYDMMLLRIPLTSAGGLSFHLTLTTHTGADRLPSSARRYLNPKDGYLETSLDLKMQLIPHTILQQMRLISALRLKIITLVSVPNLGALNRMAKQLDWTCFKMSLDA